MPVRAELHPSRRATTHSRRLRGRDRRVQGVNGRPTKPAAPTAALPRTLWLPLAITAAFAALVVTVLGMIYAAGTSLGEFDDVEPARDAIRPPPRYLALAVDYLGEPVGAAILLTAVVSMCLVLRHPRLAALAVVGSGLTVATTSLLKPVVGRTIHGHFLSYPSGHTALITAVAFILALVAVGRLRTSALTGTLLVLGAAFVGGTTMAWAQVALGAHYPTDTVGGFCTAIAIIPATAWLLDRAADRLAWQVNPDAFFHADQGAQGRDHA